MRTTARFDSRAVRGTLLARGGPDEAGFIRFAYRPFDNRWLYWEKDTKLLDEKRADYRPHVFDGNRWLVTQKKPRRAWSVPQVISSLGCLDLLDRGATCFPAWFREDYSGVGLDLSGPRRGNLSAQAKRYLDALGAEVDDMFQHVLAVLHDSAYHEANAGALRMGWPRIPLPGWPRGEVAGAAEALAESAERGRRLAALLDSETPVPGVTRGALSPATASIAVPATTDDGNMVSEDFAVTAGWGYFGIRRAVMPGQGCFVERPFSAEERLAMGDRIGTLGDTTFDIYINARAFWRNVPAAVWSYKLGGYQVLKKWLSYRERAILDRPLTTPEVQHFSDIARRLAAILLPRTLSCE